ncbi:MAG: sensor histidine kinase [Haliscomenobacteraceae bacterium CHB4]|nr:Adaptive-response sensory-kinase SasA [Saprospiraceae bacterium]MCE7922653.1 sensor histidine kinase [Haliscomenobacteraceae bacterium CHB4]
MTNAIIRRVIVLGAISMLSLLAVQTYWVLRTWDLQEQEFNRKVTQALMDAANELSQATPFELPSQDLIDRLSSNYYVVNVDNDFDPNTLEFFLKKSFESQGLHEDFQYGVFDCSSKQMVTGKTIKYNKAKPFGSAQLNQDEALPPHTKTEFNYYFGVRFPDKYANILSNMWIVIFFTALMLVTLAFFIYSMFVILRQKQLSELQRDFINNMTHEFKTPISTINISTDVFLNNEKIKEDARLNRYSHIIKEQVLRLNTQVEKVLQLAKIERDKIELNLEEIDLTELVRGVSPSIEMKVHEAKGTLQLDLDAANAIVMADRLHLTNIIHNLVDNGVKYSKGAPDIRIGLKNEGDGVVLSVRDNGVGIAKEHQKHIFDKFYRVPTGNVHNVKGFGLGLFYVKTICKEHKWKINLHSEPGKGTTIEVWMPFSKA